jgi:CheY-like chemotaxis protein
VEPLRILHVEDNTNDADLVRACLEDAARDGAEIHRAHNLAEGLQALVEREIDLTLLDLDLPDSRGFETLERLRAAASGPVIVLTANPHPLLVSESLKRRAYEVLHKNNLDAGTLMRIVRRASMQQRVHPTA